jgi:hypothetical protein
MQTVTTIGLDIAKSVSFPKIISAHTDDEDPTERVWR